MKKMFILFFITIPLIDIFLFFKINANFGFHVNLIGWLFSFLIGVYLINRIKKELFKKLSGSINPQSFFESYKLSTQKIVFSFTGSILLVLPGLYSDLIGIFCFSYYFQYIVMFLILNKFNIRNYSSAKSHYQNHNNDVFDGDYHYVEDDKDKIVNKEKPL